MGRYGANIKWVSYFARGNFVTDNFLLHVQDLYMDLVNALHTTLLHLSGVNSFSGGMHMGNK